MTREEIARRAKAKRILRTRILNQIDSLRKKIERSTPTKGNVAQDVPLLQIIDKSLFNSLAFWDDKTLL